MFLSRAARYLVGTLRPLGTRDAAQAPALGAVHDEAGAPGRAAAARMQRPLGEGEAVVEGELGTRGDVAARGDPHAAAGHLDAAVRGARVVDQTGDVAAGAAVEVVATREVKNVNGVVAPAALAGEASPRALPPPLPPLARAGATPAPRGVAAPAAAAPLAARLARSCCACMALICSSGTSARPA